jgi:hypothetical protein
MASFGREIFPVLDAEGAPRTGLAASITWNTCQSINSSGTATAVTGGDRPTFTEIGTTGIYIVGAGANNGAIPADTRLVGIIDCGTGSVPRYRYFDSKYSDRQEPALQSDVSILADGTNGLAAIKTQTVSNGTTGTNTYNIVNNGTYGNSALNSTLTTIAGYVNGGSGSAYALLTDGTFGLSAIRTQAANAASHALFVKKCNVNRKAMDTTAVGGPEYVVFDDDGTTKIARNKTFDQNGLASATNIFSQNGNIA